MSKNIQLIVFIFRFHVFHTFAAAIDPSMPVTLVAILSLLL
jgi:hypothetical protein